MPLPRSSRDFCITTILAPLVFNAAVMAQSPTFRFDDAASAVRLETDVYAFDCIGGDDQQHALLLNTIQNLNYSGGVAQWGAAASTTAQDGPVSCSANPLVRLDGDHSTTIQLAFKAWVIDSASLLTEPCYIASGFAETTASYVVVLEDLVAGASYEVEYQWTMEARAEEENETPAPGDDPAFGFIDLSLDFNLLGPGQLFDAIVDNDATTPEPTTDIEAGTGLFQFTAPANSIPITVDMDAFATQFMTDPPEDDLASCFLRGTLLLRLRTNQQPPPFPPVPLAQSDVIISEVVAGGVGLSNPRYAELTNCGTLPVEFLPGDELAIYDNGAIVPTTIIDLAGIVLNPSDSYVIASSAFSGDLEFFNTYGFDADRYDPGLFGDGDAAYALLSSGLIHDAYGVIGVDALPPPPGLPEPWAYQESHAYRKPNQLPNAGFFDHDNWAIAAIGSIAGPDPVATLAAQTQTTPDVHVCTHNPVLLGDMNCDGSLDIQDVGAFALALVDPIGYAVAFPGCNIASADMNVDGAVNGDDLTPFVDAL